MDAISIMYHLYNYIIYTKHLFNAKRTIFIQSVHLFHNIKQIIKSFTMQLLCLYVHFLFNYSSDIVNTKTKAYKDNNFFKNLHKVYIKDTFL